MRQGIIFGAGRIGRGLLGEVFQQAGLQITFVDKNINLVDAINRQGYYSIIKASGGQFDPVRIRDVAALHVQEEGAVVDRIATGGAVVAVAVAPLGLHEIADVLAVAIARRAMELPNEPLDILLCDNSADPVARLRNLLEELLGGAALQYLHEKVGMVRTVLMRLSSELSPDVHDGDQLSLLNNGYPEMPVDGKAFLGQPPDSPILRLTEDFDAESIRKIYTLNMLQVAMAYLGSPLGLTTEAEAIHHPRIRPHLYQALEEAAHGLCSEYEFAPRDMEDWNRDILAMLENPSVVETLARLGVDAGRKLGPTERLIGPALLCQKHNRPPRALARIVAYAYHYQGNDPGTRTLRICIDDDGIEFALERFSRVDFRNPLRAMILDEYERAGSTIEQL